MKDAKIALSWLISNIKAYKVEYQIVGGLAAIAFGSKRPLADIDLYVPFQASTEFLKSIKEFIVWGPAHEKEEHWDITYLKMVYRGQKIEIGDSEGAQIYDSTNRIWVPQAIDFATSVKRNLWGIDLDVMPRDQLVAYKKRLGREVDLSDIEEINI